VSQHSESRFGREHDGDAPATIFLVGFPVVLADVASQVCLWWFIGHLSSLGGAQEVGYFRVAQTLNGMILFLPGAINPLVLSHLSAASVSREQFRKATAEMMRIIWMITLPTIVAVAAWRQPILTLLFGAPFDPAAKVVAVIVWQALIAAVGGVLWQALVGFGRPLATALVALTWILGTLGVSAAMSNATAERTALCYLAVHGLSTICLAAYVSAKLGVSFRQLGSLAALTVILIVTTRVIGSGSETADTILGTLTLAGCLGVQWRLLLYQSERASLIATVSRVLMRARLSLRVSTASVSD
jgi:O-antigen/teichoic acid export membrane protein